MANQRHLRLLKSGVDAWNQWRREHPETRPDLTYADLSGAELRAANLNRADMREANLIGADLSGANLRKANLGLASLVGVDLTGADLTEANLSTTTFHKANLTETDFSQAIIGWTIFGQVNLEVALGLESARHRGPSTIGVDTIYASNGCIPEAFLRGAGVPDNFIDKVCSLVDHTIEYPSCFVSFSTKDQAFAERLHAELQDKGVRCWFAPEDMNIGDKIWDRLDQSIRLHDKLLLVLSASSIGSEWVEDEVTSAFEEERRRGKTVLFPIRLDDAVFATDEPWARKVRQRHIGDFTCWKDHDVYKRAFDRLLRDLKGDSP